MAGCGQFAQPAPEVIPGNDIQPGRGLVQQDEGWRVEHCGNKLHAATPPARQGCNPPVEESVQAPTGAGRRDRRIGSGIAVNLGAESQILTDRKFGI